jgi:YesN/AraC family two-component response regulator
MMQPEVSPKRKWRVLIADDVQETRRNTRLMLSTIPGMEVVAIAVNGRQMIELAKEQHPDIIITDINMPVIDGLAAFKEIIRMHPDTGCIIMSAQKDDVTVKATQSLGVQEYLVKPFTVDEMESAVARVCARLQEHRQKLAQAEQAYRQSEAYLKPLAEEYSRSRRTDDQALKVFEQLAANPKCELRWLQTLAMIYIIRQEWGKLKILSARLEQRTK